MNVTIKLERKYLATVKVDAPDASAAIRHVLDTYEALEPDGYYTLHCGDSLTTAYGDEFARTRAATAPKDAPTAVRDAFLAKTFGIGQGTDMVEITHVQRPHRTSPFAEGGKIDPNSMRRLQKEIDFQNHPSRAPKGLGPGLDVRKIPAPKGITWMPKVDYRELEARTLKFYEECRDQDQREIFARLEAIELANSNQPVRLIGTPTTTTNGDDQ